MLIFYALKEQIWHAEFTSFIHLCTLGAFEVSFCVNTMIDYFPSVHVKPCQGYVKFVIFISFSLKYN